MSRDVHITVVQPPAVGPMVSHQDMRQRALDLLDSAGAAGADLICLPEYLNAMGQHEAMWKTPPAAKDEPLLGVVADMARRHSTYVILPLLEGRAGGITNTCVLLDRAGSIAGRYDKTHLTVVEREDQGVVPGDGYPVFDVDFGCIGIMTCYQLQLRKA